jgi:hypothetical protein
LAIAPKTKASTNPATSVVISGVSCGICHSERVGNLRKGFS